MISRAKLAGCSQGLATLGKVYSWANLGVITKTRPIIVTVANNSKMKGVCNIETQILLEADVVSPME